MLIQEICRDCSFLHLQDINVNSNLGGDIRATGGHVNVLVDTGHLFQSDVDRFFHDPQDENELARIFIVVPADATWAQVLAGIGSFTSVSQARKAGWNKPIENGFTPTFKVGRKWITALKPTDSSGAHGTKIEHGVCE